MKSLHAAWPPLSILLCATFMAGSAQARHHTESPEAAGAANCYNAADQNEIRLWEGRAPGAAGADPCRDIPYLRVFPAPPGEAGPKPVILVIPGGGYDRLTDTREQAPVAEYFSRELHVTAILLYYRLVQRDGTYRYPVPMWDGQRAIKVIRFHAAQLGINPDRLALFEFSAGGHLASTLALHSASDFGLPDHDVVDKQPARPDLLGLGYPVISMDPADVSPSGSYHNLLHGFGGAELSQLQDYLSGEKNVRPRTAPVFLFESLDDARISPQNSVLFVAALRVAGIPVEPHLFAHGEHGAGLAEGIAEESAWPQLFHQWLVQQQFVPR